MKKETWITSLLLVFVWALTAYALDNEFLLPGPFDVVHSMIEQIRRPDFIVILFSTVYRTLTGCVVSLICGAMLGILCGNCPKVKSLFEPVHQLIKTIPNITYILIILIWLGQENSVSVIVFCILFPVFYGQFLLRTEMILIQTRDLFVIYPVSLKDKWLKVQLPMLLPEVFSSLATGIGMGFKVCVMAEILGQVSAGIGRQMNIGRLNLDLASVFGWTMWLILVSYGLQKIIEIVQKITYRKST